MSNPHRQFFAFSHTIQNDKRSYEFFLPPRQSNRILFVNNGVPGEEESLMILSRIQARDLSQDGISSGYWINGSGVSWEIFVNLQEAEKRGLKTILDNADSSLYRQRDFDRRLCTLNLEIDFYKVENESS